MIEMQTALQQVMQEALPLPHEVCRIHQATNRVLACPVVATQDAPPFTKSLMDGFAIRANDLPGDSRCFSLVGRITAGEYSQVAVEPGQAVSIMTGAPLPPGADAVVPCEEATETQSGGDAQVVLRGPAQTGQHVLRQGDLYRTDAELLPAGRLLRAAEVALLAELGCAELTVVRAPRVAVLATGDELVAVGQPLSPGKICNSNGPLLLSLSVALGGTLHDGGIVPDDDTRLQDAIRNAVREADLLLVTGGVSVGIKDLLPSALAACGVTCRFHGVNMKPGKPLWFGVHESGNSDQSKHRCLVFGLPGNPLSVFAGFQLFARTALLMQRGLPRIPDRDTEDSPASAPSHPLQDHPLGAQPRMAKLAHDHWQRSPRPTWIPCRWRAGGSSAEVIDLVAWHGSADLLALTRAEGLALFPLQGSYPAGTAVKVLAW